MLRKQTAYKFRTKKNLILDYLDQAHHPYDMVGYRFYWKIYFVYNFNFLLVFHCRR